MSSPGFMRSRNLKTGRGPAGPSLLAARRQAARQVEEPKPKRRRRWRS